MRDRISCCVFLLKTIRDVPFLIFISTSFEMLMVRIVSASVLLLGDGVELVSDYYTGLVSADVLRE